MCEYFISTVKGKRKFLYRRQLLSLKRNIYQSTVRALGYRHTHECPEVTVQSLAPVTKCVCGQEGYYVILVGILYFCL
jgi:hypothetical protein